MSSTIKTRHTGKINTLVNTITGAVAVTPADTDLAEITLALFVNVAGSLKVTMMDGSIVTYANITAGRHMLRVKRVWAATTATGIVAEY